MKEIAAEILRQLGGLNRLGALVGAHNFVYAKEPNGDTSVSFRIKASSVVNFIKITLNWDDLYSVEMGKLPGLRSDKPYSPAFQFSRIDCESLLPLLEEHCQCYFSLSRA